MNDKELISKAKSLVKPIRLSQPDMTAADVGSAIKTIKGNIYTGICIDVTCGLGFCAEHSAVAEMIKGGETEIDTIVAVCESCILPPCGRCRELLVQVNAANFKTRVILENGVVKSLSELLPDHWLDCKNNNQKAN